MSFPPVQRIPSGGKKKKVVKNNIVVSAPRGTMGVRCTPWVPRGKLTSISFFADIIRLALRTSPKRSDSFFFIVHSARWCNIQELEVIVICFRHFLNTGFKPDENQIRDHQAELEGAYNELLQLAAARRARLDESHKLQTFYRDAEEEEMWVSEKAHSLQSTDYGHDLNSAMILLNKHEVWEWKKPLRSCMENFLDNTRVSWMQMGWICCCGLTGLIRLCTFYVHLSCRNKGVGVDWLIFRGEFGCGG